MSVLIGYYHLPLVDADTYSTSGFSDKVDRELRRPRLRVLEKRPPFTFKASFGSACSYFITELGAVSPKVSYLSYGDTRAN